MGCPFIYLLVIIQREERPLYSLGASLFILGDFILHNT